MDGGGVGGWMKVGGWQLNGMRSFMCWDSTEDLCFNKRALLLHLQPTQKSGSASTPVLHIY